MAVRNMTITTMKKPGDKINSVAMYLTLFLCDWDHGCTSDVGIDTIDITIWKDTSVAGLDILTLCLVVGAAGHIGCKDDYILQMRKRGQIVSKRNMIKRRFVS